MPSTLSRIFATIHQRQRGVLHVYFSGRESDPDGEREFFDSLLMPNGTRKTSSDRRLDDLNELLGSLLPRHRVVMAMDAAAGSGISSLEWLDQMRASGRHARVVAGDRYASGWLTTWGLRCGVLYLPDGEPLRLEVAGRVINLRSDQSLVRGLRRAARALFRIQALRPSAAPLAPPRPGRWIHRRLSLVSPRLLRRGDLSVIDDDLAEGGRFAQCFDIVRAANFLNRAYFDPPALAVLVAHLIERVSEDGLLAVCRTASDGTNHGTVFRRSRGTMVVQARLGAGSEVEDLVLSSTAARQ